MRDSGILQQAVKLKKVNKIQATHFALCNGNKIRYLIALDGGKRRLSKNISTYSNKLGLLMKLLKYLPFSALIVGKLGYYVRADLHPAIEAQRKSTNTTFWNVIVGTYDEKQKLVFQCFNKNGNSIFIKVGNQATAVEMGTEISFLGEHRQYQSFALPELVSSGFMSIHNPFNIQITKEFYGGKVPPVLTTDIVNIYKELSCEKKEKNGVVYERSHGDFTPWNLKKHDGQYILFDWEHTGFRSHGYDLMHYMLTINIALNGFDLEDAYNSALEEIQRFIPDFTVEKKIIIEEYRETIRELEY